MIYQIQHRTTYEYVSTVHLCHNNARLLPRELPGQKVLEHSIEVTPRPSFRARYTDFFGNTVDYFAIQEPHESLTIEARSRVDVEVRPVKQESKLPWDELAGQLRTRQLETRLDVRQFSLESPLVPVGAALREFALPSFPEGRPLVEAAVDLMHRIYKEFAFVPGFTTISTPLEEVLGARRGVCQDFAQLGIGCLRSLGLPARYVSGYIETVPPEGQEKLIGADASHAWFSLFHPECGWLDFDPTNDHQPSGKHIVLGYGRDFSDVSPLKGVVVGSGTHELDVAVDIVSVDA